MLDYDFRQLLATIGLRIVAVSTLVLVISCLLVSGAIWFDSEVYEKIVKTLFVGSIAGIGGGLLTFFSGRL
jgi:hypothetical protein